MNETQQPVSRWRDLRRHPAFQAAAVYAGASWAIIQVVDIFFPSLRAIRWLGLLLVLGFVAVVGTAWRMASLEQRAATTTVSAGSGSPDASGPMLRRRRRYAYTVAIALLFLGGVVWWIRPSILGAVAPDAQVIAVLPFNTSGPGVELLGEGMVDLISRNLDGVGGIRAVDSRTVLHRWRQRAERGSLDLRGSLAVGQDVDAGAVLVGSVVSVGPEVRLSADLLTVGGIELASSQVEGPADSVLALVDRLGLNLLREIWLAREPIPNLRVSGITTSSVDAIRAYLKGQKYYRQSQWDSALAAFREAVAEDSTFALAHYSLALTYGWRVGHGSRVARRHAEASARDLDRLPARERVLVVAHQLFEEGEVAAHDTMQRYVARYPDDAEGWYMLGDVRYHARPLLALKPDELFKPFDRALELDPSLAPALIHPVELSIAFADSMRFERYFSAFMAAADASARIESYRLAGSVLWGETDSIPHRMLRLQQATGGLGNAAVNALFRSPKLSTAQLMEMHEAAWELVPESARDPNEFAYSRAMALMNFGRLNEAKSLFDSLPLQGNRNSPIVSLGPVFAGYAEPSFAARMLEVLEEPQSNPAFQQFMDFFRMVYALSQGDSETARELGQSVLSADTSFLHPQVMPGLVAAAGGWADLLEGDTLTGLKDLRSGLYRAGYRGSSNFFNEPFRFQLAAALAARADTRDEGIRRLRFGLWSSELGNIAISYFVLGQAYEASGNLPGAAGAYSQFIRLWENADPELQPRVETARRALERLAAEQVE